MPSDVFTPDFKPTSYWWETTPPEHENNGAQPSSRADAVVVGAGYTGLHAAIQIARGGRSVVVLDAGALGQGCSTRNGGQISISIKPSLATLTRRHGPDIAKRILSDGWASLRFTEQFVADEGLDCDFKVVGRFHAAHSEAAYKKLTAAARNQPEGFKMPFQVIPRETQKHEIGSDLYFGGVVYENHASIDPGRYHQALVQLARQAGVELIPHCEVKALESSGNGYKVSSQLGNIQTRDVVLATNGYSGSLSPWHRRRIIPIGSYMIATERLPNKVMEELIPNDRIVSDTRRVVYYYRASPDRRRLLFGGRVSSGETDPRRSGPALLKEARHLFPQLGETRISHSWMGFVGYTFDTLAHTGSREGLHYAMGYCGSGVGMAGYLGMKTGLRVLGYNEGDTGLANTSFPTRPFYTGKPWFLSPAVSYYRLRDRLG